MSGIAAADGVLFLRLAAAGAPEVSRPDPARVVAGDPVHRTWNLETRGGLHAGIWESTPGIWRIAYEEWEYCRILAGVSVITDREGRAHRVGPGDSFVLRPGFTGTWEVVETTRKDYVILV
jgi:uncharacterized cupin superfamily protein